MASTELPHNSDDPRTPQQGNLHNKPRHTPRRHASVKPNRPNWFVRTFRSLFRYRKTSLTFLVFLVLLGTILLLYFDNLLEYSVSLPSDELEKEVLNDPWLHLQNIARKKHTYTSKANDEVHDYLEAVVKALIKKKQWAEYDNDLNGTNRIMYLSEVKGSNGGGDLVTYYESNNVLARINGTNPELPALLLSAHFDSVPSSYGVTDDGMGIASLLGVLQFLTSKKADQPERTIIFNFNNNEEFGLFGANAFLYHPWFKQTKYFLNLEGTGAGGKAILFRGTDHGIVKHYGSVRYPYASSIFQEGFNNGLIHSDTDYTVYLRKGGLRGLDVAFYKPRDIYHTARDNIANVNIKSLWHMLSTALDFTNDVASRLIGLDADPEGAEKQNAAYTSFLNTFWSVTTDSVFIFNIVLLVLVPVLSFPLVFFIFKYKKNWNVNFVNVIKVPISLILSAVLLNFITDVVIVPLNPFLINNSKGVLISTLFSLFLLLNYALLNGMNILLKPFKGHFHDEKLISIIEISFITWAILLYSTIKLGSQKESDDHSGEFDIGFLFFLQAVAAIIGLLGWNFKRSPKKETIEETRPLLGTSSEHHDEEYENNQRNYGSPDDDSIESSSLSLQSGFSDACVKHETKSFSYDWLIQFLIIVPLSSYIIYNNGYLVLDGLNKLIQESLAAQSFVYQFAQAYAVFWAIPFIPFIFKANRVVVLVLIVALLQGFFTINFTSPFDAANPIKLRFLETLDLNGSSMTNSVQVYGRNDAFVKNILSDIPSVKEQGAEVRVEKIGDGMARYEYPSKWEPILAPGVKNTHDYLVIDVLKNSSSETSSPFGLLAGEIRIVAPKNRNCRIDFNVSDSVTKILEQSSRKISSPVRTAIVYKKGAETNSSTPAYVVNGIPEGFSRDADGNYLFKDYNGIDTLQLNKLDWDKEYHLAFQWVPDVVDAGNVNTEKVNVRKLGINVECFWSETGYIADKGHDVSRRIPAYDELLHYSPNYVSWANRERGLVSATKYIEI